ncbi:MAG: UDP-N-acetylmuramoyl-L-alanyl-D-glutamate--2,6-diaminopimelate ligase [Vicinamibacterales bacterium]
MTVGELLQGLPAATIQRPGSAAALSVPVTGVAYDSRRVQPGHAFIALRGLKDDGARYAGEAIANGAACVVAESPAPEGTRVPWHVVADARVALAVAAARFFGDPSQELLLVGITGTNGKTTTSHVLASIVEAAGIPCGLMGTVAYRIAGRDEPATRTTPEAPDLQSLLRRMVAAGAGACVMEVSSHALALKRTHGLRFAAAGFTNLTRDHLDFHGSMEAYFDSKKSLFTHLAPGAPAVVNIDDPWGATLAGAGGRTVTYAVDAQADIRPLDVRQSLSGLTFQAVTPHGPVQVRSRLVGRANLYNLLCAIGLASELGLPGSAIERGIAALSGVPGRFELVSGDDDEVSVVVDYAHTDDALRNLLETARSLTRGRLITVFGCGGDRDRSKRPLMGLVATRLSDLTVVTSDNPRGEDPARIAEEILLGTAGAPRGGDVRTELDRRAAIDLAITVARPGDLVLLAGKGHEKTQEQGGVTSPFDDAAVAREALAARRVRARVNRG